MSIYELKYSPHVWRLLNGVFCVYKPKCKSIKSTRNTILSRLSNDLNEMETRPPRQYVDISGELSSGQELSVDIKESFADNPLVVGKRYQPKDISLMIANNPGWFTSGVLVVFIGRAAKNAVDFKSGQHLRVYEMKGQFGFATDDFTSNGKIVEKSWFKHLREEHVSRVVSKMQSIFQIQMYRTMGIDIKSQEAYEMAAKGMVRPLVQKTAPVIYALRLTEFCCPDFTIQIECINEFDRYLFGLIHEIGLKLRTTAMCTGLRLIRYGPFSVEHSLLYKHWSTEHILENIKICKPLLKPHLFRPPTQVLSDEKTLTDQDIFLETLKQTNH